ncbi:MAG: hypothetical protein JO235_26930 [Chroococcidiopsidaceae cyanobacterium CP_BM_RX_35]|nr:hypothetical protein [Chroococcidiopsidaceae cyanobacterium CP_BM_RX_35]
MSEFNTFACKSLFITFSTLSFRNHFVLMSLAVREAFVMDATKTTVTALTFTTPGSHVLDLSGDSETSYSIEVSGLGSITGVDYTIPAHSTGTVVARLNMLCLTSADVKNLNDQAMGMLSASQQEEIRKHEEASASANLSIWSWYFGGGAASASYKQTNDLMKKKGLTEEQISQLINAFMEVVRKISSVEININVNNSAYDYSVSGNLYFYTISGRVSTGKETREYRMLANTGSAGAPASEGGAPTEGIIVPLN